ncbi:MAG: hypothetical protein ABEH78_06335 [Haloferacaceae archaeon]
MRETLSRTRSLLARSVARRDGRAAGAVVLAAYPVLYLVALGHLTLGGSGGLDLFVVAGPLARAVVARSPFNYEPIARLVVGPVVWLISPLNLLLAGVLGVLVAANAAVAVVATRAPSACGVGARTGPLAGVLGLLSGATCCGPAVFFLLGIQATGALVGAFGALVPAAVLALVASLLLAGRGVGRSDGAGDTGTDAGSGAG